MKAHVVSTVPEKVLLYAIKEEEHQRLLLILQQLSMEAVVVRPSQLGQTVGYLAGYPGFTQRQEEPGEAPFCQGVLCMSGLSSGRMDTLLKYLRENRIAMPIKAAVTPVNQHWSFQKLVEELAKEHEAVLKRTRA